MQHMTQGGAGYGAGQGAGAGFGPGSGPGFGPGSGPGGGRQTALAPGARIAGALICVVLLGVEIAWSVADIRAEGFHFTLWRWLDLNVLDTHHVGLVTSPLDPVLMLLLVGALVAARRSSASGAFVAVGLFAVLFRLPGLWEYNADWSEGVRYHDRLLVSSIAYVVFGLALIVIALAARRPAATFDAAGSVPPGGPADVPAVRPNAGAAIVSGLLLLVLAGETAGWQFYDMNQYHKPGFPPHLYRHLLTGDPSTLIAQLAVPPAWEAWAAVVLALVGVGTAFARASFARPILMAIGLYYAFGAVVAMDMWHTEHLLFKPDKLPDGIVAQQGFLVFEIVAGLLLVLLAALRGPRSRAVYRTAGLPGAGWGAGYGAVPGAPGSPLTPGAPYTYGAAGASGAPGTPGTPGGWGGYGSPAAGGPSQQPPVAGTFGPPPSFPPPSTPPAGQPRTPPTTPPNAPPPPPGPPTVG